MAECVLNWGQFVKCLVTLPATISRILKLKDFLKYNLVGRTFEMLLSEVTDSPYVSEECSK